MAALRIEQLGKRYGSEGRFALRDFSLTVEDGELVAIVGPSGCGKSTLLRMVAGLEEESTGTVHIGARALNGLPARERDVALMFQSYTLLPHLTVEDNLAFGLKLRGVPRAERQRRAREAADMLGLAQLLKRLPSELSGGERQRVALGRAVLRSPAAFLFDEPLSSLDALMRLQLRVEIQRLHQRVRVPMLFVTHDQSEALTLGDRVVVLEAGRIRQVATPDELYRRPANAFTASFIGTPGMNLFQGVAEAGVFRASSLEASMPHTVADRAHGREALTLGVRPEHLRPAAPDASSAQADAPSLEGEVTAVERQAGQLTLYLRHGATAFAARLGDTALPATPRAGDRMAWTFAWDDVHLFAGPDGERVPDSRT